MAVAIQIYGTDGFLRPITCTTHYYILYTICYYTPASASVLLLLWQYVSIAEISRAGFHVHLLWDAPSEIWVLFWFFLKPAAHKGMGKLPSPVTRCTWTEHERLKSLQTRRGVGTRARGEACLVSTSKSLQLSTSCRVNHGEAQLTGSTDLLCSMRTFQADPQDVPRVV